MGSLQLGWSSPSQAQTDNPVGSVTCATTIDRFATKKVRAIQSATLRNSNQGYILALSEAEMEHELKLDRQLIVQSAQTKNKNEGKWGMWNLISYQYQPQPIQIQPNGTFSIEMFVSTRSICEFKGQLEFREGAKSQLFSNHRSVSPALPKGFEPATAAACKYQDFYQTTRSVTLRTADGNRQTLRSGTTVLLLGDAPPSGVRAAAAGGFQGILSWGEVETGLKPLQFGKNHKTMRVKTLDRNGAINLRNAPEGAIVGTLRDGETVSVQGVGPRDRSYYWVESTKGVRGMIAAPYLVCT